MIDFESLRNTVDFFGKMDVFESIQFWALVEANMIIWNRSSSPIKFFRQLD
jgi:hypothetical protein